MKVCGVKPKIVLLFAVFGLAVKHADNLVAFDTRLKSPLPAPPFCKEKKGMVA